MRHAIALATFGAMFLLSWSAAARTPNVDAHGVAVFYFCCWLSIALGMLLGVMLRGRDEPQRIVREVSFYDLGKRCMGYRCPECDSVIWKKEKRL